MISDTYLMALMRAKPRLKASYLIYINIGILQYGNHEHMSKYN